MERKNRCCIETCKGERFDLAHRFPRSYELTQSWLQAIDNPNLKSIELRKLSDCYQVCARHFRISDYRHPKSRNLNKLAIPSLNLKDLSQLNLARDSTPRGVENISIETDLSCKSKEQSGNCVEIKDKDTDNDPVEQLDCIEMCSNGSDNDNKNNQHPEAVTNQISFKITNFSTFFEIEHPKYGKPLSLNAFWLRFNCECSICFDSKTERKKFNFMELPRNIQPKEISLEPSETLFIKWEDNHYSMYDVEDILKTQSPKNQLVLEKLLFDSNTFKNPPQIEFTKLVCFDQNIEKTFVNLILHGFVCVTEISTQNTTMAKLALQRLFPHYQTINFEPFNEIHSDICTNFTCANFDCGLKCFFVTDKTEIILVDGLNVVEKLKKSNAFAFDTLTTTPVSTRIRDNNVCYEKLSPIISVDHEMASNTRLLLDTQTMGTLNMLPQEEFINFYDSLKLFVGMIQSKDNQINLSLEPRTMIILDNWRVLHKLSSNVGMWQCYLGRNDFIGRARYLGLL